VNESIKTLNEYQAATETVAVYPGSDREVTTALTEMLMQEIGEAMRSPEAGTDEALAGAALILPLLRNIGHLGLFYTSLGLAGESGEFCEKVKKLLRDGQGVITDERRLTMAQELGDILWYVAQAAKQIGFDLEAIANINMNKLLDRKDRGVLGGSGDSR